nr:hypothetical protein BgiMline_010772 [Biomphalaria glabrata]
MSEKGGQSVTSKVFGVSDVQCHVPSDTSLFTNEDIVPISNQTPEVRTAEIRAAPATFSTPSIIHHPATLLGTISQHWPHRGTITKSGPLDHRDDGQEVMTLVHALVNTSNVYELFTQC